MRILIPMIAMSFAACDSSAGSEAVTPDPVVEMPRRVESFEDVLQEYQAFNTRLEAVAYRLQKANVDLCPKIQRTLGFTVHTITDYPEDLRDIARVLLPVSDGLSLRTVRDGSPAAQAGLRPGDQLVQLSGQYFPRGGTASKFYKAAAPRLLEEQQVEILSRRGENEISVQASPESLCGYPVNVFFSERINGHTDGAEVWITSELMRTVPDDVNLALIVAHEMAHAIAGHVEMEPHKRLELEADRMALIMLERAGYDIDTAINYWADAQHPHSGPNMSQTHPSIRERLTHFNAVREFIRERQARGAPLDFTQ